MDNYLATSSLDIPFYLFPAFSFDLGDLQKAYFSLLCFGPYQIIQTSTAPSIQCPKLSGWQEKIYI
jgi:hypothetical protein